MRLLENLEGGYRFLTGIDAYSSAVIASPGNVIVRAVLRIPVPYVQGITQIRDHLLGLGRPIHALCGVELRIPKPLSFDGFAEFNREYFGLLKDREMLVRGRLNPVARTNVAPATGRLVEPSLYAFSYTIPDLAAVSKTTFVIAGAGDLDDQTVLSPEAIVAYGETSARALNVKAAIVLEVMAERLHGVGANWGEVTAVNVYTVRPIHHIVSRLLLPNIGNAAHHGLHWHYAQPPISGLEYEMDMRGIGVEISL